LKFYILLVLDRIGNKLLEENEES